MNLTTAISILCLASPTLGVVAQQPVDFAHDIMPIIKARCAQCHTNGNYQGGLSLETRGNLLDSRAVVSGDHQQSDLYDRIVSNDEDYQMPPDGDRLSQEQAAIIARWIDEGLQWPEALSLKASTFARPLELRQVELPSISGVSHPIDLFIQEYFTNHDVAYPKPLQDHQFVRRLKLDLLGQLPAVDELTQFNTSNDPAKRENLIREFLNRDDDYADHWITFWNDLLRNDYAGTGYIDGGRKQITSWLHQSLVANKPFDEFVCELINRIQNLKDLLKALNGEAR